MGWGGRLFEAGRLLTFSAVRMGAYSRWALIRGWALIRINTVATANFLILFVICHHPLRVTRSPLTTRVANKCASLGIYIKHGKFSLQFSQAHFLPVNISLFRLFYLRILCQYS